MRFRLGYLVVAEEGRASKPMQIAENRHSLWPCGSTYGHFFVPPQVPLEVSNKLQPKARSDKRRPRPSEARHSEADIAIMLRYHRPAEMVPRWAIKAF